ncbi:SprT-like domain-containing protein [Burkholderia sp. LMG 13014]|uniref:SprT-like domain-containing protein n=1 Tax=Burkholderia sp. LMG 13014 TaxID=2709306 RepID=UPI001F06DCA9|nr:SprT-like domain-containing protein [Burkholderia sp. LMG 13014]
MTNGAADSRGAMVAVRREGIAKNKPTVQAYAELQQAYDFFNDRLFGGVLPDCLITFQRQKRSYGYYSHERFVDPATGSRTDEIAMNCEYFASVPLIEILQTLVHEMVHLWQTRFGTPSRKGYHNREFANQMKEVGLMPSSTGAPGGAEVGQHMADYAMPGGPFLRACETLLQGAFRITWMDRFPVNAGHIQTPEILEGDPAAQSLVTLGAYSRPVQDAPEVVTVGPSQGTAGGKAPNRSNRLKFVCPVCGDPVWGKPTLANVKHGGECGDALFAVAAADESEA